MARLSAVLIADSDPRGLETLRYGFEGDGCRVQRAPDPREVPALVKKEAPQIVVLSSRDSSEATVALLARLREDATGSTVPVLVLGSADLREAVKQVKGVDFLPLPTFVRDVITACRIVVAMRSGTNPEDDAELQGALSDYGMFFVVRTMLGLGRPGVLQVERANRRGELRFREGELTAAQVGSLQGFPALHHLLLWEEAALDLRFRKVVHRGQFHQKVDAVLDEAERFLRDFAHAKKDLGSVQTVFDTDEATTAATGDQIPAEVVPVIKLFDGKRTLGDVIEDSPFRVFDTVRIASRMVELGVLKRRESQSPAAAPSVAGPELESWLKDSAGQGLVPGNASDTGQAEAPNESQADHRTGAATRRKTPRRERPVATGGSEKPASGEDRGKAAPLTATPTRPRRSTPSGVHARGEIRATARMPTPVTGGPSVVVDLGPAVVEEATAPSPAVAPPAAPVAPPAAAAPRAVVTPPPLASPPARPPVAAPAARQPTPPPVPTTVPQRATANGVSRAPTTTLPAEGTLPSARAQSGSIEIDPALMAEMDALEMASTPPTPQPLVLVPAPSVPPNPAAPSPPAAAPAAKPALTPAPSARRLTPPRGPGGEDLPRRRGPSGEFSAVEADFFAREEDLYKREAQDNFEDLDHSRPKK